MRKTVKNAIKICYSKRQCVSASGGLRPPNPLPGLRPWTLLDTSVPRPPRCSGVARLWGPGATVSLKALSCKARKVESGGEVWGGVSKPPSTSTRALWAWGPL